MDKYDEWVYWEQGRVASDPENYCNGITPNYPQGFLTNGMTNPEHYEPVDYSNPQTRNCLWVVIFLGMCCVCALLVLFFVVYTGIKIS